MFFLLLFLSSPINRIKKLDLLKYEHNHKLTLQLEMEFNLDQISSGFFTQESIRIHQITVLIMEHSWQNTFKILAFSQNLIQERKM
jgi:hypothetical protein